MFQTKSVQKIKTHILCSVTFSPKSCHLWDNVEKYYRSRQVTDGNMAHAHCMLDTWRYRHTLRICNTYYVSTATVVTPTGLNIARLLFFKLPSDIFLLSKTPGPALGLTKPPFQGYRDSLPVVKRSECEVKHSPPYCRGQEWVELYFHFPLYVFMAWTGTRCLLYSFIV